MIVTFAQRIPFAHLWCDEASLILRKLIPRTVSPAENSNPVEEFERLAALSPHLLPDLGFIRTECGESEVWTHPERDFVLTIQHRQKLITKDLSGQS